MSEKSTKNPTDPHEEGHEAPAEEAASPPREEPRGQARGTMGVLLGALFDRGRRELERAASTTRVRLDLRQLRKDRDTMYLKLGREARSLIEAGEIEHPGIRRGVERIAEIDKKIAQVEAEMSLAGITPDPDGESSG